MRSDARPRRLAFALLVLLGLAGLSGCGTVTLVVPEGRSVRLLEQDEPTSIRAERKLWFWLWGARAISDNTTRPEIEAHDLKEIRIYTVQTLIDNIITMVTTVVSLTRITLVVEGNT